MYKQVDGCSMGGPLSPTLANLFLCYYEQLWLNSCPEEFQPIFYRRFVDDCFVAFKDLSHVELFAEYLNSQHSNIKFTYEIEKDNKLPFLDMIITKEDSGISSSVYRKPTFTGLGLNFFSFIPYIYKINSIHTLLQRAYSVSSSYINFHAEIEYLKEYFINNKFAIHIIENAVAKFLDKLFTNTPLIPNVPKKRIYIKLPFYGSASYRSRNELRKLLNKAFYHIDFRIILTSTLKISSFF